MANSFEALWQPSATSFEPMDLGGGGAPAGFDPMVGFDAPPAPEPEAAPEPEPADDEAAESAAGSGAHEPVEDADIPSDVALMKAREEAYEIGRAEGLEAGQAEIAAALARVEDLLEQIDGARKELMARSVQDLATAVVHIAGGIVGRELAVDSDGVEKLVRSIFDDVRADDEVVVRVAEQDSWMMREAYPALLEMVGRDGEVRILVDPSLQPGGAIVETSHGTIDASIEAQLASFADAVEAWAEQEVETFDD